MENAPRQSNPVGWFEIYVDDLARARAFYEAVFQRPLENLTLESDENMQMCMFAMTDDGTGAAGALVKSPHMGPGTGGTLIYFICANCAEEASRVADHGGTILQRKKDIGKYGFIAIVRDTEGNTIGLHSMQ